MQFAPSRPKRPARENIVPMINVVFLLLIFFLMTAQIAPPDPFDTTPPPSTSRARSDGLATLYISAGGLLAYQQARGENAVLAALGDFPVESPLLIRADLSAKATTLAQLLPKLAALGITDLSVITTRSEQGAN